MFGIKQVALHWVFSRRLMSNLRTVHQIIFPYSKWGLTKLLYKRLKLYISKWTNVLQIKPIIWLALFTFPAILFLNLRCSSFKIPRSFNTDLFSNILLCIVYACHPDAISFTNNLCFLFVRKFFIQSITLIGRLYYF